MAEEKQSFTIRLDSELYEAVRAAADKQKRSMSNLCEVILTQAMLADADKREATTDEH